MHYMTAKQIRESFLAYFESKGHKRVPSSSLVPYNDHTLLFTNAGMVQFKDVFLGLDKRDYSRAVTAQRCVRAGGKHNDLDTVGRTARHHTFFEMMGNFSFGDYFKRDAIAYAWEYLTQVLAMPKERLYVTIFEEDDEAFALWQEVTGIAPERIFRIGAKDNFWAMGDTGPCGPCSEIFFDRGEKYGCDAEVCGIGSCDCDRWMEIWNLVFMQYDRNEDGVLTPLPQPSIDTGLGLERVASILQEVDSNYDTDIMRVIISGVEELCGKSYHGDQNGFPFRVISDHMRACSFMIADGIMPSNEGRGYVLRRILRRAARFGMVLGLNEPFLYRLFPSVKEAMADHYPILIEEEENILRGIRMEEERFHLTLKSGLNIVEGIMDKMRQSGSTEISGSDLFLLYDTYGFPLDLVKDIAEENNFSLDEDGFKLAMEQQRSKSQTARAEMGGEDMLTALGQLLAQVEPGRFLGYEQYDANGKVIALAVGDQLVNSVSQGQSGWLALDATPFYGESGGQIGDIGILLRAGLRAEISDTQKLPNGLLVHRFLIREGALSVEDIVNAIVDVPRRQAVARNHSATHLLHRALRMTLGDQVHQAGSLVNEERLRFDFNHFEALTAGQLQGIEDEVNRQILANLPISSREMPLDDAKASGAAAFFGDKYGDMVRVLSMGEFSRELCGGTHCQRTGDIGSIKIISESGIGAGIRRIEAVTGEGALKHYRAQEEKILHIAAQLKTVPDNIERRLEILQSENKALAKENEKLLAQIGQDNIQDLWQQAEDIGGIQLLAAEVAAPDMAALRNIADMLKDKLGQTVLILAAAAEEKTQFVVAVSTAAQEKGLHAGKLIKEVAAVCGGGGGGRADMAQAGGKHSEPEKIKAALDKGLELARQALTK